MKKKMKWIVILSLISMMLLQFSLPVAAQEKIGSITVQLEDGAEGTSKVGVEFSYVKVADIVDGDYVLAEQFSKCSVDLNQMEYAELMEKAAKLLMDYVKHPDGKMVTDETGVATVKNLKCGVYLLYVSDQNQYEITTPTLVSIPTWDEAAGQMLYRISVMPKHSPNPDVPEAPKTGDPAPMLFYASLAAIAGAAGIAVSILMRKKKK